MKLWFRLLLLLSIVMMPVRPQSPRPEIDGLYLGGTAQAFSAAGSVTQESIDTISMVRYERGMAEFDKNGKATRVFGEKFRQGNLFLCAGWSKSRVQQELASSSWRRTGGGLGVEHSCWVDWLVLTDREGRSLSICFFPEPMRNMCDPAPESADELFLSYMTLSGQRSK